MIDLDYAGTGGTLQRYQYGYDAAGNRLYARITQVNHDNDRSYLYGYDALNRLILAERGQITPSASGGTIDTGAGAPVPEARLWRLDNLGNWAGGEVFDPPHDDGTDGSLAWGPDADGGGVPDAGAAWTHHATDRSNRITQITKDTSATPTTLDYDLAGNLVSDGTYFLQYDGFNRLVQVNQIGTATLNANGEITGGTVGDMVVQFVYDGLGRLIRTVRPQTGGGERIEDHYYDGVRRIQTDVTVGETTDTDRQYVYTPDYVDEFVAQIDSDDHVFYMLQDGNYNVVALVGQVAGAWQVVEQYAYRPYGSLVAVDSLGTAPANTAGHQGLFYEHIDGGTGLAVGATGFYYNRNRFYSPALGRFLQRDPNETAMPLLTALATNGQTLASLFGAFDPQSHFGDGMNVYLYLGANPLNGFDPSGLYDPFQDVDDQIDDLTGHKLYALATLNEGARWVALGLQTASQIALSLIPGYGVYEAYQSVQIIRSGRGGLMDYMTVGLAGFSTGVTAFKAVKLIAKAAKWGQRGSRLSRAALKFKSFIKSNFRANLKILTGLDPPPNVHAHHMFPNKFANEFSARGINIHDPKYGAWWPGGEHLSAARGYNDLWADFFTGNPTAGQILEKGRQLASRFGLEIGF